MSVNSLGVALRPTACPFLRRPVLAALLAAPVAAGAAAAERASPEALDRIVITASRRAQPAAETEAPVAVVAGEALARLAPQTLADLARGAVGAFLQQTTPGQGNVILRGLKGSEVLHLVDGVRLNNAFFRNAPNQYLALVDAQNVERLEILRGPASALYGGDAMGGVIQVFTPEPRFLGQGFAARGRLRGFYQSADGSLVGRLEHAYGREGFGLAVGLTDQSVRERRIGGGRVLPFTAFRAEGVDVRLLLGTPAGGEWLVAFDRLIQPSTPRHDALVPGFGQSAPENSVFLFEPNLRELARLRWRLDSGSPALGRLELQLARQEVVDDRRTRAFGSSVEERERNSSRLDSLTLSAEAMFAEARLVYGAELLRDRIRSARTRQDLARGTPPTAATARFPDGSRQDSEALFAQLSWPFAADLRLGAGLRLSRHRIELPPADRGVGVRLDFGEATGDLGVVRRLGEGLDLVLRLAQGFRPPNVFDLGTLGPRPGNRFNLPNPALGPERILSGDLGLRWRGERFRGELFAYRARYRDKITSVLTGERDAQGRLLVQSRNLLRQELRGLEAGAELALGGGFTLSGSLLSVWGEERTPERVDPADRIPPLSGRLALAGPVGTGRLELAARFADRQDRLSPRDRVDPRIDPRGTAGFAVLDAVYALPLGRGATLQLRAENLFDRRYREHGSGLDAPGRSFGLALELGYGR